MASRCASFLFFTLLSIGLFTLHSPVEARSGGKLSTLADLQNSLLHSSEYSDGQKQEAFQDRIDQQSGSNIIDQHLAANDASFNEIAGDAPATLDDNSQRLLIRLLGLQTARQSPADADGTQTGDGSTLPDGVGDENNDDGSDDVGADGGNQDGGDSSTTDSEATGEGAAQFVDANFVQRPFQSLGNFASNKFRQKLNQLKIKSKLLSPLFGLPANLVAPIVKLKSNLGAPFTFKLNKILPLNTAGLEADGSNTNNLVDVNRLLSQLQVGLQDALAPLAQTTQPLVDALAPLQQAVDLAQNGLPLAEQVQLPDQVATDVDNLANNVLGALAAQVNALNVQLESVARQVESLLTPDLQTLPAEGEDEGGDEVVVDETVGGRWGGPGTLGLNRPSRRQDVLPLPPPPLDEPVPPAPPVDEPFPPPGVPPPTAESILPPVPPQEECLAYSSGMVTNPCSRVERYRVRICRDQKCPFERKIMQDMEEKCEQVQLGFACRKDCYVTFRNRCTECNFTFNRILNFHLHPYCAKFKKCLYDDLICRQ